MSDVERYLAAARVPVDLHPQRFGLWEIRRHAAPPEGLLRSDAGPELVGWPTFTLLCRWTLATVNGPWGEVVMEDSRRELLQHMPIWLRAHGRVLVTGLGLGCVVRGLLANPRVEHIDVVEIDGQIIDVVGPEFAGERVTIHHGDAVTIRWPREARWDVAWHDLWTDTADGQPHLQRVHGKLFIRYRKRAAMQGAWRFPRLFKKLYGRRMRVLR